MIHARPDYQHIQDPTGKIPENEPVFLLRAQDRSAAAVVRYWADLNATLIGHDDKAIAAAIDHARRMEDWPRKKTADL